MKKIAFVVSVMAVVAFASCSPAGRQEKATAQKYQVISPLVRDTVYTSEYVADISALQNVGIRARVAGFIENVFVDEGHAVRKGQTLFSISDKQFRQDLDKAKAATKSAQADLNSAEIELEGSKNLFDKNYISKPEYDLAVAKVDALKAKMEEAKTEEAQASLNLSYARVIAPFDGVIDRIPNKAGSLVEEGALLTTISNDAEMYAYFNVSESEYLNYTLLQKQNELKKVTLILANGDVYNQPGVIETAENEFDKNTGTIAFRAKFPNPQQLLKHGATGKIQLETPLKKALLIPQKSTFEIQGNIYVFLVRNDNTVEMRKIVPLHALPLLYVVGSGLTRQDRIIYEGTQKLKEGDKIIPEEVSFR